MATNAKTVADICAAAELGDEAIALVSPDLKPRAFLDLLMDKEQFPDAVRFLAHCLPKREAVWWSWVCARRFCGPEPAPKFKTALDATEKWIAQPNDDNRRVAMKAAEFAGLGTPAGCAGLAAFMSGTSLAPPDLPAVPPGEHLTAKAVAGAVVLAAVSKEPELAGEKFRAFLGQGLDVVGRIKLPGWET
jgi:hypothetical protein